MKVFTFVLAFLAIGGTVLPLPANDDLVKLHYRGTDFLARQLVKGHLHLYVSNQYEEKKVFGPLYRKRKVVYIKRYFLKYQDRIEKISPYNYKKVLRKFLPNAPELHRRIGKAGFRYENIPSIIRYYNEFRVPELELVPDEKRRSPILDLRRKKD